MAAYDGLEEHAEETTGVDARVIVEAHVLGGDEGVDEIGRNLVVGDIGAVLQADETQHLAIVGQHLGGLQAAGILQLLERGHEAQPSQREEGEEEEYEGPQSSEYPPNDFDIFGFFLFAIGHIVGYFRLQNSTRKPTSFRPAMALSRIPLVTAKW